jgi:hypothetical protein
MRRLRATLLCASVAILFAPPAGAETWRTYHNVRFGQTAEVPADWSMEPPLENDDGRVFSSPNKRATITVSGIRALGSYQEEMTNQAEPYQGETISYTRRGDRWIVASGTKDDNIFYRKSILTCRDTIWNSIYIVYPKGDKEKYDKLVARVSASLTHDHGFACN